ncbi:MAG: FecCD family ABC transporter permease [Microbacteriaceae bacterium]
MTRAGWQGWVIPGLAVTLLLAVLGSAMSGQLPIAPGEVLAALGRPLGIGTGSPETLAEITLWNIRFPRIAAALLIGTALAVAGLMMQAVFANPLAEPAVVGVSSGAALGAAGFLVFVAGTGASLSGDIGIALAAFIAGLITTALVYGIARHHGRTEVVTLVLTGIAINAFAGGALAFMLFAADSATREQLVFWQLGSLNGTNWTEAALMLPLVAVGIVAAWAFAPSYDVLALGERSARHLGVRVERVRILSIVVVALLASAAVAFAGIIAFVGLVVPHLMRLLIGPAHRPLVIASALGGALLLTIADWVARTAVPFADLPIGMLTSLVGGPFFLWLLLRTRARMGGFA